MVIIAHRPSLLRGVDKLLVLRDGVVERFGPRAEIMARVTRGSAGMRRRVNELDRDRARRSMRSRPAW